MIDAGYIRQLEKLTRERTGLLGIEKGNAIVCRPNEPIKNVKNLGWLLRNWKDVERFYCCKPWRIVKKENVLEIDLDASGAFMVAELRNDVKYCIFWASADIMHEWLNRPVFKGVELVEVEMREAMKTFNED